MQQELVLLDVPRLNFGDVFCRLQASRMTHNVNMIVSVLEMIQGKLNKVKVRVPSVAAFQEIQRRCQSWFC